MDRPKTSRSAKWGAACAPCAAAKARCLRTHQSRALPCDRCQSLEKNCSDQIPRLRKKRQAKSSAHDSSPTSSPDHVTNIHSASSIDTEPRVQETPRQEDTALHTPPHDFTSSTPSRPRCTCMATVGKGDLVPVESDETLLSIYKNQLSSRFPFVIIPPSTTARQLQATRPLLMKVIRMVASVRHLRLIRGQSRAVMDHISQAMLVRSERSLDLLQGILVFLGSYHYHCMTHGQFNNLTRLAVSLVEDMDLGTCPKSPQRTSPLPLVRAEKPMSTTNEERRALLGVWYMSSNAGLVVNQLAVAKYTKYLDQCLTELEDAGEYKTDQLAVQLVRIQRLTEQICHFHSRGSLVDEPGSPEASTTARLESFRVELDRLRNALQPKLKSNYLLSCYYYGAYLRIFEPLLAGSHLPDAESQSFASLSLSGVLISDVFSHFTAALKAWLDNWLAIPVCSYFYMPQPVYAQLVHAAMMLTRWTRVAGPSAVKLCSAGTAVPQKEYTVPALSGVPSCPDLNVSRPPASASTQVVSAQILSVLRTHITAQPNLQIDICAILDTMAARFESAKEEMAAAQGVDWENDTWDLAAEHCKMKKVRIEKWCDVIASAAGEGSPLSIGHDSVYERDRETMDISTGRNVNGFEWLMSGYYDQDDMQWESAMFDEILRDIHSGVGLVSGGLNVEVDG